MNFFAHFYLSGQDSAVMAGNFLADFMDKRATEGLPPDLQRGVALHREIDTFTDEHPAVLHSARLLYSQHHKYAPVLVDIFYDFFLIRHWDRYGDQPLQDFCDTCYAALFDHIKVMNPVMQKRVRGMVEHNWLRSYGQYEGLDYTLLRMRQRVSQPEHLDGAVENLKAQEVALEKDFHAFFPDIIGHIRQMIF